MRTQLDLDSNVEIVVREARIGGLILSRQLVKNLVVDAGLQQFIDIAKGDNTSPILYAAVGTSATAVAAGQTVLGGEVFRNNLTTSSRSGNIWTMTYYLSSTQANGSSLQEYGEFNALTLGVMLARATYTAIAKTSSITVTYTHSITLSAS